MLNKLGEIYFNIIKNIHIFLSLVFNVKILTKNSVYLGNFNFPHSDIDFSILFNRKSNNKVAEHLKVQLIKLFTPWYGEVSAYHQESIQELSNLINPLEAKRDSLFLTKRNSSIEEKFIYIFQMLLANGGKFYSNTKKWDYHFESIELPPPFNQSTIKSYFSSLGICPYEVVNNRNSYLYKILTKPTYFFHRNIPKFCNFLDTYKLNNLMIARLNWEIVGLNSQLWDIFKYDEYNDLITKCYNLKQYLAGAPNYTINDICPSFKQDRFYSNNGHEYLCPSAQSTSKRNLKIANPILPCIRCLKDPQGHAHQTKIINGKIHGSPRVFISIEDEDGLLTLAKIIRTNKLAFLQIDVPKRDILEQSLNLIQKNLSSNTKIEIATNFEHLGMISNILCDFNELHLVHNFSKYFTDKSHVEAFEVIERLLEKNKDYFFCIEGEKKFLPLVNKYSNNKNIYLNLN